MWVGGEGWLSNRCTSCYLYHPAGSLQFASSLQYILSISLTMHVSSHTSVMHAGANLHCHAYAPPTPSSPCCLQALRQMGLEGVLVLDVPPGTPADKAGMQVGGWVQGGDMCRLKLSEAVGQAAH